MHSFGRLWPFHERRERKSQASPSGTYFSRQDSEGAWCVTFETDGQIHCVHALHRGSSPNDGGDSWTFT
jgi:hypothetical protein